MLLFGPNWTLAIQRLLIFLAGAIVRLKILGKYFVEDWLVNPTKEFCEHVKTGNALSNIFSKGKKCLPLILAFFTINLNCLANDERIVEIEKWDFGIVTDRSGPTKDWKLHPVVCIPNLAGVQYAWKLKTNSMLPVFVREEFTLPEAPSTWKLKQGESSTELKNGGEQCVLESFQATDEGWVGHAWTASHGDPPGKYQIKVWLNGKLAHDFVFNVGEAPKIENDSRDW